MSKDNVGYIFEVVGRKWNDIDTSYGLCFSISEDEARGQAVSYFQEQHPGSSILKVSIKQIRSSGVSIVVENNLLVGKEVKEL